MEEGIDTVEDVNAGLISILTVSDLLSGSVMNRGLGFPLSSSASMAVPSG